MHKFNCCEAKNNILAYAKSLNLRELILFTFPSWFERNYF